jgi:hypothetical protein
MSNLKPIRLFDTEIISGEGSTSMQNIHILRMVYLDMFFMFLGRETDEDGDTSEFLYLTKSMEISKKWMIHHQTLYIDKVITSSMKMLYTFGIDCGYNENYEVQDKAYVFKIWDWTALVGESCKCTRP